MSLEIREPPVAAGEVDLTASGGSVQHALVEGMIGHCYQPLNVIRPTLENHTIKRLLESLKLHSVGTKEGSYFTTFPFQDTSIRSRAGNIQSMANVLVLDGDHAEGKKDEKNAPDPSALSEALRSLGIGHIIYSSHSHQQTGYGNRYRVVFKTARAYSQDELRPTVAKIIKQLHTQGILLGAVNENNTPAQPWYYPRKASNEALMVYIEHEGKPLDIADIEAAPNWVERVRKPLPQLNGQISQIDAYNLQHSIEDELLARGDVRPSREGGKWIYSASTTKKPGISVKNNKMYSHSGSDPLCDGYSHSCFDVMMDANGLTFKDAMEIAGKESKVSPDDPDSLTVYEHNKIIWRRGNRGKFTGKLAELADSIEYRLESRLEGSSKFVYWNNIEESWVSCFIDSKTSKVVALNDRGDLPTFALKDFMDSIRARLYGSFFDVNCMIELAEEAKLNSDETKLLLSTIDQEFQSFLKMYRQRNTITYKTDMFAITSSLSIEEESVLLTSVHKPFAFVAEIVPNLRRYDYMAHYPRLDELISLIVAARFATDRKKAFFWLHAPSDWGKGFLTDIFRELGILVELSVAEVAKAFKGEPIGRCAKDFKHAWILLTDEPKNVTGETKQLTSRLNGCPKNEMNFVVELYAKVFTSAEGIASLAGEQGVEAQFGKRFSSLPVTEGVLDSRPVFIKSKTVYFDDVKNYVAGELNRAVAAHIAAGRVEAANLADKMLGDYNTAHSISHYYGSLNDSVEEIAGQIKQLIKSEFDKIDTHGKSLVYGSFIKENCIPATYRDRNAILVQNIDKLFELYISNNVAKREQTKVEFKKADLKSLIDDTDRAKSALMNSVLVKTNGVSTQRKGVVIYT